MWTVLRHGDAVDSEFDIFERFPDDSVRWRMCVRGATHVGAALEEFGKQTKNECFAMNIRTHEIIARVNCTQPQPESSESSPDAQR
jgi:hypothetical protein